MSDSRSTVLVQETTAAVQRYLEVEGRRELPTSQMLPEGWVLELGHGLNRVLRRAGLHVSRVTVHDEAMRRRYSAIVKSTALGTVLQVLVDPVGFDAAYAALSDDESRRTFDWFISYRTALAYLGEDADEIVPGAMSAATWQTVLQRAGRTFVDGAYHVSGLSVDSGLAEVATTFLLEQYRLNGVVEPQIGDVVLDCGAYRGETALWFAQRVGESGIVIAFEPVVRNVEGLRRNLLANQSAHMAPVTIMESAVSSSSGTLNFNTRAEGSSRADTASSEEVTVVTIDDVVERQHLGRVDFIKMDIEGGEVAALKGAKETLRTFIPRLAISAYHRPNDLPDITALVLEACPRYRLYLSQKSPGLEETILFASGDPEGLIPHA